MEQLLQNRLNGLAFYLSRRESTEYLASKIRLYFTLTASFLNGSKICLLKIKEYIYQLSSVVRKHFCCQPSSSFTFLDSEGTGGLD